MARRKTNRRNLTKNQVGDLRERIEIGDNVLRPGGFDNAGMVRIFTPEAEVWAKVETVENVGSGEEIFNDVNTASRASHIFTMRYRENFTSEKWIRWRGEAYRVEDVRHPEERGQWTVASCYLEGDETKEANT